MKCYSELLLLPTLEQRYYYLRQSKKPYERTFGDNRYLNQMFYASTEWQSIRRQIIIRDKGCDLALDGYPVGDRGYVHHINPITIDELEHGDDCLFDPENLILCSFKTHNAIHFGEFCQVPHDPITRVPGDTCLWR